jgi:hypothetical protein
MFFILFQLDLMVIQHWFSGEDSKYVSTLNAPEWNVYEVNLFNVNETISTNIKNINI